RTIAPAAADRHLGRGDPTPARLGTVCDRGSRDRHDQGRRAGGAFPVRRCMSTAFLDAANESARPMLPLPTRARWQPLRIGLVDLFHYDSEEFWFRDGHLLLRGNNGTGKSKVLSLTLPFLFDGQIKSSR